MLPALQTAPFMVDKAAQYVTSQLATSLNATTTATSSDGSLILRPGILDSVTPMSFAGTAIPRGRMYAECQVLDAAGNIVGVVWRGYLQTTGGTVAGVSSSPGMVVEVGWRLRGVVTQTGQGAITQVGFLGRVTSVLREGGYIHSEAPGSGEGELRNIAVAAPAAGGQPSVQTVGAKCRVRLATVFATFTANATVANRRIRLAFDDGANNLDAAWHAANVAASEAVDATWFIGAANVGIAGAFAQTPLPEKYLDAGMRFQLFAQNIQAGDQWSASRYVAEEWAVP